MLFLFPVIAAFVGWAVIQLAGLFLFYPKKPWKLGFWTLQGILPKLKDEWAQKSREKTLISANSVEEALGQVNWEKALVPLVDTKLGGFTSELKQQMPMIGLVLQGSLEENLIAKAKDHAVALIPELQHTVARQVVDHLDIEALLDKLQIEETLYRHVKKKINYLSLVLAIVLFVILSICTLFFSA